MGARVLLVDDDAELRALVAAYLRGYGMQVTTAADGAGLRAALGPAAAAGRAPAHDVLLLDLMLPDADGLALCRWVHQTCALPVIVLTAQGDPASRVIGLEIGADDYVSKPFEPRELVARIHAVLRRANGAARTAAGAPAGAERAGGGAVVRFNGWCLDRLRHTLTSPAQVLVGLSTAEFRMLSAFVDHPRRVLSRERLLELSRASGAEEVTGRSIDLGVSRLRQKLGDAARDPQLIRTVRGEGYVFDAEVTS